MLLQFPPPPSEPLRREFHVRFRRRTGGRFCVIATMIETADDEVVAAREFCGVICTPDWHRGSLDGPFGRRTQIDAANDEAPTTAPLLSPLLIIPPPYTPPPRLVR